MEQRIVAVVVTWNRRVLLERVLRAIDVQTRRPDAVIVVDNASTDGSAQMARELDLATPLTVLELPDNSGELVASMPDWPLRSRQKPTWWLMDDDGVPMPDCLATLLPYAGAWDFWGPAVVAEGDPSRLCFPIRLPGRAAVVHELADVERAAIDGLVEGIVIPFNGVLVTRELVTRIGLPREEFFIWGDDVEYLWRAKREGARTATVVAARFEHPATDDLGSPMMLGRTTYNHSPSDLKHYCLVRNNITNLAEYVGALGVIAFVIKTLWFYTFTKPSPRRLRLSAQAARAAGRATSPDIGDSSRESRGRHRHVQQG